MISLCLATRQRPEHFLKLCSTALYFADHPENIEFVTYHDVDDRTEYYYVGNHKEVFGPRSIDIFAMANECQKVATGPIYMFTADDFYFESNHWDTKILDVFDKYDDKIVLVCPEGKYWKNWRFSPVGFLHKNWVDTVGYLLPQYDGGQAADRWVNELARSINRRVRLEDVIITHENVKDQLHHEKNKRGLRNHWSEKYWTLEVSRIREKDIEKLRDKCTKTPS